MVDDEEMLRELVSETLEAEGYAVEAVGEGTAALEAIAARRPDLVLLDLNMPGMNGWQVMERLDDETSPPAVVAISGSGATDPERLRGFGRFVHAYIPKPFGNELLLKTIERVLVSSRTRA